MSADRPLNGEDDALAAEYVSGILPLTERVAFERRLESEPLLRKYVRFWDEKLLPLTETVAPIDPPKRVLTSIENQLFANENPKLSIFNGLMFWRTLSFTSLAALAGALILYAGTFRPSSISSPIFVAELSGVQPSFKLLVYYDREKSEIKYNRINGVPLMGRDFELWLIVGKEAPLSLGVLSHEAKGTLKVSHEMAAKFIDSTVAITDEPSGGSPTGHPTGSVLATGSLISI